MRIKSFVHVSEPTPLALQGSSQEGKKPTPPFGHPSQEGIIPYRRGLVTWARELRKSSTPTEIVLWQRLKNKQLGVDFDRQRPLLGFIVDFYCKKLRLAIEIDGASHKYKQAYDRDRENLIRQHGVTFLRFTTAEIENNITQVLHQIQRWLNQNNPLPGGVPKGRGGSSPLGRGLATARGVGSEPRTKIGVRRSAQKQEIGENEETRIKPQD